MTARDFAIQAHGEQKYGDKPYVVHLDAVRKVAGRYLEYLPTPQIQYSVLDACFLHDVLEDTEVPQSDLMFSHFSHFSYLTFWIVRCVTNREGANRKEKAERTYPVIRGCEWAVFVKLCDRIANVEASIASDAAKYSMYAREYPFFKGSLYRGNEFGAMWAYLDNLFGANV